MLNALFVFLYSSVQDEAAE